MFSQRKTTFDTISQRVLYGHRFVFADFTPIPSAAAGERAQESLHRRMGRMLDSLYENPALLDLPLNGDDSYPWYLCNNQKPETNAIYLQIFKTIHAFYRFLYIAALYGRPEGCVLAVDKESLKTNKTLYKPAYGKLLREAGVTVEETKTGVTLRHDDTDDLFGALFLLARTAEAEKPEPGRFPCQSDAAALFRFVCCAYQNDFEYILRRIDRLYGYDGLLLELQKQCLERGYTANLRTDFNATTLSFRFTFENAVGGFTIYYNPRKTLQFFFGTLNGIGEKAMLEDFDSLDEDMKAHFIAICRSCRDCMGCTKGGRAKPFAVHVAYGGKMYRLCPQFPRHEWERFDPEKIRILFKYHALQEQYNRAAGRK